MFLQDEGAMPADDTMHTAGGDENTGMGGEETAAPAGEGEAQA